MASVAVKCVKSIAILLLCVCINNQGHFKYVYTEDPVSGNGNSDDDPLQTVCKNTAIAKHD